MIITIRIEQKRRELKMTQGELAKIVGLTQGAVSMIENGERQPSLAIMLRIAAALGCTVEELTASTAAEQPA